MNKHQLFCCCFALFVTSFEIGQQRIDNSQISYFNTLKPNTLVYHDTLYNGSRQFKALFLRTDDQEMIHLYKKHQANKVWGNIVGTVGGLAIGFGVGFAVDRNNNNQAAGWYIAGGGFLALLTSGHLILSSQQKLYRAIDLFNKKYSMPKTTTGLGVTENGVGLVMKL
jgi:hypothetical protein